MVADTIGSIESQAGVYRRFAMVFGATSVGLVTLALVLDTQTGAIENVVPSLAVITCLVFIYVVYQYRAKLAAIGDYHSCISILQSLLKIEVSETIRDKMLSLMERHRNVPHIEWEIRCYWPEIRERLKVIESREEAERDKNSAAEQCADLKRQFAQVRMKIRNSIRDSRTISPAFSAERKLKESIE